ncbi:MAG: hypothetical protein ACK56I_25780, partial [bacterium]
ILTLNPSFTKTMLSVGADLFGGRALRLQQLHDLVDLLGYAVRHRELVPVRRPLLLGGLGELAQVCDVVDQLVRRPARGERRHDGGRLRRRRLHVLLQALEPGHCDQGLQSRTLQRSHTMGLDI